MTKEKARDRLMEDWRTEFARGVGNIGSETAKTVLGFTRVLQFTLGTSDFIYNSAGDATTFPSGSSLYRCNQRLFFAK